MEVMSIEFMNNWSWGLIFNEFEKFSNNNIKRLFMNEKPEINEQDADVILIQNVSLLDKVKDKIRSVCRLGGNRSFDDERDISKIVKGMSECYALIATNNLLYQIALASNPNSYLIPNGINLKTWYPCSKKEERPFTVGFCGNISSKTYREYKGYDRLRMACKLLGVELKEALYKDGQIPHDKMMKEFYWKIDCLVHPTLGEGSSNTIMEACACGVPIITTREAGFNGEFMKDGYDVLFCTREIMDIKDKIQKLMNKKTLQEKLGRRARRFAEKHHDIKVIAKKYEEIFQDCYRQNQKLHV